MMRQLAYFFVETRLYLIRTINLWNHKGGRLGRGFNFNIRYSSSAENERFDFKLTETMIQVSFFSDYVNYPYFDFLLYRTTGQFQPNLAQINFR